MYEYECKKYIMYECCLVYHFQYNKWSPFSYSYIYIYIICTLILYFINTGWCLLFLLSTTYLNPSWHSFHKIVEALMWECCLFFFATNLLFEHISKVFSCIQIWSLWRPLKNINLIVMFLKPIWYDVCFVKWCIIMLGAVIRRWVNCSHKEKWLRHSGNY